LQRARSRRACKDNRARKRARSCAGQP
jgi:hypothetical protein